MPQFLLGGVVKILHLILKSVWYDKIDSGNKKSEYRECKPYWDNRLRNSGYTHVKFRRGYGKYASTMMFEIKSISITHAINDLNLPNCWEIKLGNRLK